MNKNVEKFISYATVELLKNKIGINLSNSRFVDLEGGKCSGYFDENSRTLAVGIKKPQKFWVRVLVHEFSHFLQWIEDSPIWLESVDVWDNVNLWSWLDGKEEHSKEEIREAVDIIQLLEQDCDKRAVELIKEFKLPIDLDEYIRCSNAYVLFYNIVERDRTWYKFPVYEKSEIVKNLPNKFISKSEYRRLPKWYYDIVKKECL